jgi:starch synthase (maltosyl-transferring)
VPLPRTNDPPPRIQIQRLEPILDCGRYAPKRTIGDRVAVCADVFRDGHDVLGAAVKYKRPGEARWRELPMEPLGNDRWRADLELDRCGRWSYRIEAWTDRVASYQEEVRRKVAAGQQDLGGELSEGAALLERETLTVEDVLAADAWARAEADQGGMVEPQQRGTRG